MGLLCVVPKRFTLKSLRVASTSIEGRSLYLSKAAKFEAYVFWLLAEPNT
jgi:hypothetical protein